MRELTDTETDLETLSAICVPNLDMTSVVVCRHGSQDLFVTLILAGDLRVGMWLRAYVHSFGGGGGERGGGREKGGGTGRRGERLHRVLRIKKQQNYNLCRRSTRS